MSDALRVRVAGIVDEADRIRSYELVSAEGRPLPSFSAGSHVDVEVAPGLTRQYTLCGPADRHDRYVIAVLHDAASRGGSRAVHERFAVGTELTISTPRNHFALAHPPERSLLLAGGIGITPILAMAERLATIGEDFTLHYAARTPTAMAFRERIERSVFASCVHCHFDDGDPSQRLDFERVLRDPAGRHLYVCGPTGFIGRALDVARDAGWTGDRVHREFFAADPAPVAADGGFEVRLASDGRVVAVPPDRSVVDVLAAIGIDIPTSCCQGVCGTCLTRVIDGEPDHRDLYLMDDEKGRGDCFLPCVSRAKTPRLTLDL